MQEQLDDLNDLVSELKNSKSLTGLMVPPTPENIKTVPENINENNVDDFIFRKSSILIQQGVDTIEAIKGTVLSGADAETIEAYSKLMSSVTGSIEILNKINIQKRKEVAAKALKQMDMDASSKLLDKYDGGVNIKNQTNNIIVASRDEIIKAMLTKADSIATHVPEVIDVVAK
jgi:hypothetical protein